MIHDAAFLIPWQTLVGFLMAAIVLNLTPGADVMFTVSSGIKGGIPTGIAASFGVACGSLFHVTLTTFGLAAVIAASPWVFGLIKWAGVAYLLFLAYTSWTSEPPTLAVSLGRRHYITAIKQGCITNITNPKVALFVLAFLPQFTDPTLGPVWLQLLQLGIIFTVSGFVITSAYGACAGVIGSRLQTYGKQMNRISAIILGGLAVRLAWN